MLNTYSLQQSLAYRSWRHRNKHISSIDNSSIISSIRSQTSKEILQKQFSSRFQKISLISFFSSLTISTSSKENQVSFTSAATENFTLDRKYNSREKKHKFFEQVFFELIRNLKRYRKTAIYRRWINNEDQSFSRDSSLVLTFNWSHLDSDFISRFEKSTSKKSKEFSEIFDSLMISETSKSLKKVTQKSAASAEHETSSREILSSTYFSVFTFSNHLIEFDIFDRIRIFFFRDHLTRLKQAYIRNNDQSISKYQSVEINVEKVKTLENLSTVNSKKKVAKNLSNIVLSEKTSIQESMKFFISHISTLSREFSFSLIEFFDSFSLFIIFVWSEIPRQAFNNLIKHTSDFEENFITVVEQFITLTNSSDIDSLNRNWIVEFIIISSSDENSHQNSTVKNEEENIESMSFIENSSELSADSEFSEENQLVLRSTLFQTDIQNITMSMFQLFIQNIQTNSLIAVQFISRNQFRAFDIEFFDS